MCSSDLALVTLMALTNRILVVCYVKIVGKTFFCFFSDMFLCLTLEFFFVVFTIFIVYLTRLISLSIIFFGKYCYLYYLGDSWA